MQSQSMEHQPGEASEVLLNAVSGLVDVNYSPVEESVQDLTELTRFHSRFVDCMEMYADTQTVAHYLDAHQGWFCRCAHPMRVDALGNNGYALTIGPFGSFGYEVEPKIGLDLLPQDQGVYRIRTIPVPDYAPQGYDVDFQASLELVEGSTEQLSQVCAAYQRSGHAQPQAVTHVEWQLDLEVTLQFPRFIHALPKSLIQNTGDRLLQQIVRQISRRLTHKVQEDFHQTLGLPFIKLRHKNHK